MPKMPSIGRVVMYRNGLSPAIYPAIVTDVYENGAADMTVFLPQRDPTSAVKVPHVSRVPLVDAPQWDWPVLVPDAEMPPLVPDVTTSDERTEAPA